MTADGDGASRFSDTTVNEAWAGSKGQDINADARALGAEDVHEAAAAFERPSSVATAVESGRNAIRSQSLSGSEHAFTTGVERRPLLGEILVQAQKLRPADIELGLGWQAKDSSRLGEVLIKHGLANAADVIWALGMQADFSARASAAMPDAFSPELVTATQPRSKAAEVIRSVRAQLLNAVPANRPRSCCKLALISANPGDGKTYLAANLAVSLAQLGHRTLLIEADLRMPRLGQVFHVPDWRPGLSEVLRGLAPLKDAITIARALPHLHLVSARSEELHSGELLQQPAFALLMSSLDTYYEYVLVDTPAFSMGCDAEVIAERCGAALLVARTGHTVLSELKDVTNRLRQAGVLVTGVVMNAH